VERALSLRDLTIAVVAVAAGVGAGVALRLLLRRLPGPAQRFGRGVQGHILAAVGNLAIWLPLVAGLKAAAEVLPLSPVVRQRVTEVLVAALILAVTIALMRVVAGLVQSVTVARSGMASSATIFANIARIAVLAVGVLVLLQTLGISIAPILTALGVGGLAVALALQDTLANLFAGVHILASRKVKLGDYIQLSTGEEGYVVDINWRNTVVHQLPDNDLIVPNALLANATVTNTHRPTRQVSVPVQLGVGYDSDLAHVERVTVEVGKEVMREVAGGVHDHEPTVRFHTFGEYGIGFSTTLRADEFADQYLVKHEFIKRLHSRYQVEGIQIPVPSHTATPERTAA
jgi:small-conductance mechanosensitive channel